MIFIRSLLLSLFLHLLIILTLLLNSNFSSSLFSKNKKEKGTQTLITLKSLRISNPITPKNVSREKRVEKKISNQISDHPSITSQQEVKNLPSYNSITLLKRVEPIYPLSLRKRGIEGVVEVQLFFLSRKKIISYDQDKEGIHPSDVKISFSSGLKEFEDAAINAAKESLFGTESENLDLDTTFKIQYNFILKDEEQR